MNSPNRVSHKNLRAKNNLVFCRYHPNENLIDDHRGGSLVCPKCGLCVIDRMVSEDAEWRNFNEDDSNVIRSRVGATENALLSSEKNLETSVSSINGMNEYGATIFKRYAKRSVDKALLVAFRRIDDMADRINLPEVVAYRGKYIYRQIFVTRKYKGNIIADDAKAPACLYLACQQEDCPRTLKEISAISDVDVKYINKARHKINTELKMMNTPINSKDLVPRFCGNLNLSGEIQKKASIICQQMQSADDVKRMFPESVAGASIYIATQMVNQKQTKKDIASAIGLTPATISRSSRLISRKIET